MGYQLYAEVSFLAKACSRLVWGVLYGIIYFLILCVVSIILSRGISSIDMSQMVKGAIVCILCGAIGGIVS